MATVHALNDNALRHHADKILLHFRREAFIIFGKYQQNPSIQVNKVFRCAWRLIHKIYQKLRHMQIQLPRIITVNKAEHILSV